MAFRMTVLGTDVEIEAPVGTPLSAVRELCEDLTGPWPPDWDQAWTVDGETLAAAVLGFPPLLAGSVLPPPVAPTDAGLLVEVVAGPSTGTRVLLGPGTHVVGRPDEAAVGLDDPSVSRRHAELRVARDGSVTVRDLGSLNGTALLRENHRDAARGRVEVRDRADLLVGDSVLRFAPPPVRPAVLTPDGDGHLLLNRPPRLLTDPAPRLLRWPAPEPPVDPPSFPVLALVVPLAVAGVLALLWTPLSLLLGLASPVLVGGQWWSGRRRHRLQTERRSAAFDRACRDVRREHRQALAEEHSRARDRFPDAAVLLAQVVRRGDQVFGRSPGEPDHLVVRLGLGDVPATSSTVRAGEAAQDGAAPPPSVLHDTPVTLPLSLGPVGLCGDRSTTLGCSRFLLAQLAGWESPAHLRLLFGRAGREGWQEWLPHTDATGGDDVLQAAVSEVRRRRAGAVGPAVLVVLDDVGEHRRDPRLAELLGQGAALGVHVLCRAQRLGELPTECRTVVDLQGGAALVRSTEGARVVRPDLVDLDWASAFARALAPLRDAGASGAGAFPEEVALADLLPAATPEALRQAWAHPPRGLPAVLGADGTGPCALDLVTDGPHTLVAGTTGSGKSVLLTTLVTSLAVAVGPRDLQFVLVDYKGGAAFGECAQLPHVAGLVTDLDEHLAARVLRSLRAEVARRERVLAQARVADAGDLPAGTLPRLVVVVDEFRVLAQEVPEFVDGLVRLASVGRSLGVHLVLATQRPAGVVSPEIRANTDVRIALRVADRADAEDVVGDARPAGFTRPGRALLRRSGSGPQEFQTAATRTRRPPAGVRVGRPGHAAGPDLVDDLPRLLDAVRTAAQGLALPPAPWLPPLPTTVAATSVPAVPEGSVLGWGVLDLPDAQRRGVAGFDLAAGHHLLVVGGVRSGRTTLLRRLVVAAAEVPGSAVHVLDAGGGLADLAGTGKTGSVVSREEVWRACRLVERLQAEVDRRRAERLTAATEGHVLLVVDGWEAWTAALTAADPAVGADGLLRLLREAAGVGVRVVVAGDRQSLTGAVAASAGAVVLLRVADRTDGALLGIRPADVPRQAAPGRGLLVVDGTAREVQVALPPPALPGPARPGVARDRTGALGVAPLPAVVGRLEWSGPGVALGRGGDDGGVVAVEVRPVLLVCGPAGSGRTTALRTVAAAHEDGGGRACWVRDVGPEVVRRAIADGALLLVDDVGRPLAAGVEEVVLAAVDVVPVVVAGEGTELVGAFRGLAALARSRARTLVLLGRDRRVPAEVVGRRSVASPGSGPGAGFVVTDGRWTSVRVADLVGHCVRVPSPTVSG